MKIIISAHIDLAKPVKYIKVDGTEMSGLIDNFAGVFPAYKTARETGAELYLTNFEEVNLGGAIQVAKDIKNEKAIVIVVDTCKDDTEGKGAYIGNAYNFPVDSLRKKFGDEIYFKDGLYEPTEDETAIYGGDHNFSCFYFGIPIDGDYHDTDNKIALKRIDRAGEILTKVVKFLQNL